MWKAAKDLRDWMLIVNSCVLCVILCAGAKSGPAVFEDLKADNIDCKQVTVRCKDGSYILVKADTSGDVGLWVYRDGKERAVIWSGKGTGDYVGVYGENKNACAAALSAEGSVQVFDGKFIGTLTPDKVGKSQL